METKTFDARGMACPLPVVNAKKESEEMTNGGTLIILVDNEIAVQNLTKLATAKALQSLLRKNKERFHRNLPDSGKQHNLNTSS